MATIVGTLTHELGHNVVATFLGFEAHLNYNSTWFAKAYPNQAVSPADRIFITLGGPIEAMLSGATELIFLFLFRKSFQSAKRLSFGQWTLIFITLFWLRQFVNFAVWFSQSIFNKKHTGKSDEIRIAQYFQIPKWSMSGITAIIGVVVLLIVIFNFVPIKQRLTFTASGLVGGSTGYIFCVYYLGKVLLP